MPNEKYKIFGVDVNQWLQQIFKDTGPHHMRMEFVPDGSVVPMLVASNGEVLYYFPALFPTAGDVIDLRDFPVDVSKLRLEVS